MAAHPSKAPSAGTTVYFQAWFRDPGAATGASRSDALTFTVGP